jgi:hypothetical protein
MGRKRWGFSKNIVPRVRRNNVPRRKPGRSRLNDALKDYRYNLNGQVLRQDQYDQTTTNGNVGPQVLQAQIRYSSLSDPGATDAGYYDAAGNLTQYQLQNYTGTAYTNAYAYSYLAIGGSYRESRITGSPAAIAMAPSCPAIA